MKLVQKYYSRHTPKSIEEYANLDDSTLGKLSRGQRLQLLEEETDKAERNNYRYRWRKSLKHGLIGAGVGGGVGALALPVLGAIPGAFAGGMTGMVVGDVRGGMIAKKEGHDPEDVSKKVANRMDEYARAHGQNDDYGFASINSLRTRKTQENASNANTGTNILLLQNLVR